MYCRSRGGSASPVGMKGQRDTQSEEGNAKKHVTHNTFAKWKHDHDHECHCEAAHAKQVMMRKCQRSVPLSKVEEDHICHLFRLHIFYYKTQNYGRVHLAFRTAHLD